MQIRCPNCDAAYDVPDDAIGPNGRRIRCRACDTSWLQPPRPAAMPDPVSSVALPPPVPTPLPRSAFAPITPDVAVDAAPVAKPPSHRRFPWLLLALCTAVVALGAVAAVLAWGPDQVASRLGLAERRVPLGIAITREPDWRLIAGGSQLFAVSGRIWNPTTEAQTVPDIRAELRDHRGHTVYSWTIARPVARLAAGAATSFDGAAVDVPASSANVSVTFVGTSAP